MTTAARQGRDRRPATFLAMVLAMTLLPGVFSACATMRHPPQLTPSPDSLDDTEFSDADRYLFLKLFRPRYTFDSSGRVTQAELVPVYYSLYGVGENNPLRPIFVRNKELFDAHLALLEEDDAYRDLFQATAKDLLSRIAPSTTEREGRTLVYPVLLARGIYHRILERAGPSAVSEVPEVMPDAWGSSARPFASGWLSGARASFPDAAIMFHYCAGVRAGGGTGLTLSASPGDPYRSAHEALLREDDAYRRRFFRIVRQFERRAVRLDPMDLAGAAALTKDFRTALVESGIIQRIQAVAQAARAGDDSADALPPSHNGGAAQRRP